jgi:3-oxoacyl-(acyl-carrier-protein) synthase
MVTGGSATIAGGMDQCHACIVTRNDDPTLLLDQWTRQRRFVLGEGAGALKNMNMLSLVEQLFTAKLVVVSADAYHITAPHPDGFKM